MKVLLVEDSTEDIKLLREALGEESKQFVCCVDAESALQMFSPSRFAVVLIDLGLPGIGGMELIHRIHRWSPETIIHVITGSDDPKLRAEAIVAGATGYWLKPYKLEDYRLLMRQIASEAAAFERGEKSMKNWRTKTLAAVVLASGLVVQTNFHPLANKISTCVGGIATAVALMLSREEKEHEKENGK